MALIDLYVTNAGAGTFDGSSLANAMPYATMLSGATAGNRYWVSGTITRTTADTMAANGTVTSPIVIVGFATTPGDGYQGRTNGNGPLITTNMPAVNYTGSGKFTAGSFTIIETINFSASVNGGAASAGADSYFRACKSVNSASSSGAFALLFNSTRAKAINCDAQNTGTGSGAAITAMQSGNMVMGCRATTASTTAAVINCGNASGPSIVKGCTIYGGGAVGISMSSTSGTLIAEGNTIVGNAGDGIDIITGSTASQFIMNNMITDNGGYGVDLNSASNAAYMANNRYRSNTSGNVNSGTDWASATSYSTITTAGTTASDYVNYAGGDYSLIAASPATSAAVPLYASIGALQRLQTGGGGGGTVGNVSSTFVM